MTADREVGQSYQRYKRNTKEEEHTSDGKDERKQATTSSPQCQQLKQQLRFTRGRREVSFFFFIGRRKGEGEAKVQS